MPGEVTVVADKDDLVIGQRIAHYRKVRRLTQTQLAQRAHVSHSLLSKVEAGLRPATPVLVASLAPVLGVSVSELNGQPYFRDDPRPEPVHASIPALHGALARYDIPLEPAQPPRSLAELHPAVEQVNRLRQTGSYSRLGLMLPGLLDEVTYAAHLATGDRRPEVFRLLAAIYFAAHSVAYKLGYDQLATIAEDRIVWAARQSDDRLLIAVANWTRCTSFLSTGAATGGAGYTAGLTLLGATRTTSGRRPAHGGSDAAQRVRGAAPARGDPGRSRGQPGDRVGARRGRTRDGRAWRAGYQPWLHPDLRPGQRPDRRGRGGGRTR